MLNTDIAYLLGMIVGKGEVIRENKDTQIIIHIPHRNLFMEGENTQTSIKSSLLDIIQRLKPLVGSDIETDTSAKNIAHLSFSKDNRDYLIRNINTYLKNKTNWRESRIPDEVFESSREIKKEFLKGLADVTAHIRKSNVAWGNFDNRVYIEIMDNWDLVIDISNLLKSLDVPIQTIRWGHPSLVDPRQKFYKKGVRNYKEHQIKIWAEEFEKIGFNIEHKNNLLKMYADLNCDNWDNYYREKFESAKNQESKNKIKSKIGNIKERHHKFYWESERKTREKICPKHPDLNNPRIHPKIRGRQFNHWTEIARELGYHE